MIINENVIVKLVLEIYHKLLVTHFATLQDINLIVMIRGLVLYHEDFVLLTTIVSTQEIDQALE